MARYLNNGGSHNFEKNNGNFNSSNVVEISPSHFNNKERNRWFDFLSRYTNNFIQEDEKNESFRKR